MSVFQDVQRLTDDGLSQQQIAKALGLSRFRVSNLSRVLRRAEPQWRLWAEQKKLSYKHLEAVLLLPVAQADALLRSAMAQRWPAERLRQEVRALRGGRAPDQPHADADVAHLEQRLSELLATRVSIHTGKGGNGELRIGYTDLDTLDGVLERLGYRFE